MKRAHICGLLAAFLPFASLAHAAPEINLEPFESQCRDEIMSAQCKEGNCYQLWKPIVKCAFTRAYGGQVSAGALDACINRVTDERQVHNLVLNEVYSCLTGE